MYHKVLIAQSSNGFCPVSVNSGLKLIWSELLSIVNNPNLKNHQRRNNAVENTNSVESCETYLMRVLTNTLSLKQLARIVIRNRIIDNMNNQKFVSDLVLSDSKYQLNSALELNHLKLSKDTHASMPYQRTQETSSILECLIWQLDLPKILHFYLYAFPDVPSLPEDIAVFVND